VPPTIEVNDPGAEGGGSWRGWTGGLCDTRELDARVGQDAQRARACRRRDAQVRGKLSGDRHQDSSVSSGQADCSSGLLKRAGLAPPVERQFDRTHVRCLSAGSDRNPEWVGVSFEQMFEWIAANG